MTRKLWLAAIPVLLDLFLWLGPKLSVAPIVDKTIAMLRQSMDLAQSTGVADANISEMVNATIITMQETFASFNLLSLVAWGRIGVPSIASLNPISSDARTVIQISELWQMASLQIAILAVGLLIACAFLALLASQLREGAPDWQALPSRVLTYWVRMVALFVPFGIGILFALFVSALFGPLAIFMGVLLLWVILYLSFVPQAIILGEAGSIRALWSSFTIVRFNFWSTIALLVLVNLISAGLGLIWYRLLMPTTIGTAVAILLNSYVGTGLTLAVFIYYRDRLTRLEERLQQRSA